MRWNWISSRSAAARPQRKECQINSNKQTVIDFSASTYRDKGHEVYPLTRYDRSDSGGYVACVVAAHEQVAAFQRWLLPGPGWMLGRPKLHPHVQPHPWDWYIDLATIEVGPERWQVNDHEIDLLVFENQRYEVLDLDEFVDAIEVGSLQIELGLETIRSLHRLCTELDELNFSVDALLQRHAPSLPAFQPWDSVTAPR